VNDLGTSIIDAMATAELNGFTVSEIALSESQRDWLVASYCFSDQKYHSGVMTFNGARVVVKPPKQTHGQKAAAELRALADKLEKQ